MEAGDLTPQARHDVAREVEDVLDAACVECA